MMRCLELAGYTPIPIPVTANYNAFPELLQFAFWKLAGRRRFLRDRTPRYLRAVAREVVRGARDQHVDAYFAPSSLLIAELPAGRPAFFWTDAAFAGMVGFYESFSRLPAVSLKHGYEADRRALSRATIGVYASTWAAQAARTGYPEFRDKVAIIPFGANLEQIPSRGAVAEAVQARKSELIRLLFMGVDWDRKGGAFAWEVVRRWRERGDCVELHVVGCEAPPDASALPWVVSHGFITKSNPEGRARLAKLFQESEWLILPSRAECFGVVFAEAAAFGLPSVATRVGGIPSAIKEGQSGFLFSLNASPDSWVEAMQGVSRNRARYQALAMSARTVYETELNWEIAGQQLSKVISPHLLPSLADHRV